MKKLFILLTLMITLLGCDFDNNKTDVEDYDLTQHEGKVIKSIDFERSKAKRSPAGDYLTITFDDNTTLKFRCNRHSMEVLNNEEN